MQREPYFFDKMHDLDFHKGDNIFTWWISAIKRNDNVLEASWKEKFLYKSTSKAIVHWKIYIYTHMRCEAFPLCWMKYAWNQEVWWKIRWRNLFHIFHCNDSFARDSISITGKIHFYIYFYRSWNNINFQKAKKYSRYNVKFEYIMLLTHFSYFSYFSLAFIQILYRCPFNRHSIKRWKL